MGHYAVLVIHRPEQTVEELLAPYDESLQLPEHEKPCHCIGYRAHWDETLPGAPLRMTKVADESPDPHCDFCQGTGRLLTTGNPHGKWDWYLFGGQFRGALTGYNAAQDPDNWQVCRLCRGTGQRTDLVVPDDCKGCNGCRGTGREQKPPSQWNPYPDDTLPVSALLQNPSDWVPCAVVTPSGEWREEGLISRYAASLKGSEEQKARLRELLVPYRDCLVTVVDLHF